MRKYKVEDLYATIITDGYYAKDYKRISDIVNKYNVSSHIEVIPEIEGYIQK